MSECGIITDQSIPHVLVVDDEPEIRHMISLCLKKSNFNVATAESVAEACNMLVLEHFDAILSDVMMPGEDGIAFLARVHELWPDIPVILMTGHAQLQMAANAIKNGAFDFICKPFDFELMRKIILRAVNYSKLQRIEKNYRIELEETVLRRTSELKESMSELDYARAALQQAATAKSTFMSTVSHEMRTPMNGVLGALELIADEGVTGMAAEYLAMARESAESMIALINQMLSFATQSSAGEGNCNHDLIDPRSLLHSLVEGMHSQFTRKGVTLDFRAGDDVPRKIWTDHEKFSRLFTILLGNALKFTHHGAVQCELSHHQTDGGDLLNCAITDSGIGIPEGMLEQIFEPFVQGDSSLSRSYEGVGLGLSIARQNAALLNGQIWAEHVPSGGSRFIVVIKISTP